MHRQACASTQSHNSINCSQAQSTEVDKDLDRNLASIIIVQAHSKRAFTTRFTYTVQSLYNVSHYNTDLDITLSCCGSQFVYNGIYNTLYYNMDLDITRSCFDTQILLQWNFTKDFQEIIFL